MANLSDEAYQKVSEGLGEALLEGAALSFAATLSRRKARKFNAGWKVRDEKACKMLDRFMREHPEVPEEEGRRIYAETSAVHDSVMKKLGY